LRLGLTGDNGSGRTDGIIRQYLQMLAREVLTRAKPVLKDVLVQSHPILQHFKDESKLFITDFKKIYLSINMTEEEVKLKQSVQFMFTKFASSISETKYFGYIQSRLAAGTFRKRVLASVEKVQTWYNEIKSGSGLSLGERFGKLMHTLAESYDRIAKRWSLKLSRVITDFRLRLRQWLTTRWHDVYHNYQGHVITTLNDVETSFNQVVNSISSESFFQLGILKFHYVKQ